MIETVAETGSTNADLLARINANEVLHEGTWLVADRQGSGRGRQGRVWQDASGNFMGSTPVAVKPDGPPPHTLSLVAGLALYEATVPLIPPTARAALKWPNDLLLNDAKLAGILLERSRDTIIVGIGVNLAASVDVPALDCAYKLQDYRGTPKRKLSEGKQTWPGRKQVWRSYGADDRMAGDVLTVEGDKQPGEALIEQVMRGGKRVGKAPTLADIRARAQADLARLPEPLRQLQQGADYPVEVAEALKALAKEADQKTKG